MKKALYFLFFASALTLVFFLTKMSGPKFIDFPIALLTEASPQINNVLFTNPNSQAWFSGLLIVVEKGRLQQDQAFSITLEKSGVILSSNYFKADSMLELKSGAATRHLLFLQGSSSSPALHEALGYGEAINVSASFQNPNDSEIRLYFCFVDDRLIK